MSEQDKDNGGEIPLSWFGMALWKFTPRYGELVLLAICLRLIGLVEPFIFQVIIDRILPFQREARIFRYPDPNAAPRMTWPKVVALAECAAQAGDADGAELWDGALHRHIADIAGNPILRAGFTLSNALRQQQRWQHERQMARSAERVAQYARQHAAIIAAIQARDAAAARVAMQAHLA